MHIVMRYLEYQFYYIAMFVPVVIMADLIMEGDQLG